MKFAICNETFEGWPLDRAFGFARECGYTGIEIAPFTLAADASDITPQQQTQIRAAADQAGLEIVGLHWLLAGTESYYLTSPDREIQQRTSDYFQLLARLCRDLGGKVMVLGSPGQRNLLPGVTTQQATDFACEVLQAAMPVCEACDVTIALEPLGPSEGDFLLTAESAIELAGRVDSPRCRLLLDCKAMSSESQPPADIIRDSRAWLAHFHANDPNLLGPGMGELPFEPILAALREIDYQDWVSVEVFKYEPSREAIARQSIEHLQSVLASIDHRDSDSRTS